MNNPFLQLDKKQFPSAQGRHLDKQKSRDELPAVTNNDANDDECGLFLRAMSNVTTAPCKAKTKSHGFLLNEQVDFQNEMQKNTSKSKKETNKNIAKEEVKEPEPAASDENMFWKAMQEVAPLSGSGRSVSPPPRCEVAQQAAQDIMASFMEGKLEFALANTDEYCEGHVVGLDEMTMNKLRAGALSPEAHLDLHGLNTVQAFEAMRNFMRASWYKALRTVLIIPGRGQNSPNGIGILRSKVQDWLTQEPFRRVVLAFCTAQQLDGGLGSMYVLLRKYKKKGRIYWERTPNDVDLNEIA